MIFLIFGVRSELEIGYVRYCVQSVRYNPMPRSYSRVTLRYIILHHIAMTVVSSETMHSSVETRGYIDHGEYLDSV